jgi:hypothetical protein
MLTVSVLYWKQHRSHIHWHIALLTAHMTISARKFVYTFVMCSNSADTVVLVVVVMKEPTCKCSLASSASAAAFSACMCSSL